MTKMSLPPPPCRSSDAFCVPVMVFAPLLPTMVSAVVRLPASMLSAVLALSTAVPTALPMSTRSMPVMLVLLVSVSVEPAAVAVKRMVSVPEAPLSVIFSAAVSSAVLASW